MSRTIGPGSYSMTLFRSRVAHPIDVDRSRWPGPDQRCPAGHERRRRSGRDAAAGAVRGHGDVYVCAVAGAGERVARGCGADAAAQRGDRRHVGARRRRPRRRRVVLHRDAAAGGEPIPRRQRALHRSLARSPSGNSAACGCSSMARTSQACGRRVSTRSSARRAPGTAAGLWTRGRRSKGGTSTAGFGCSSDPVPRIMVNHSRDQWMTRNEPSGRATADTSPHTGIDPALVPEASRRPARS